MKTKIKILALTLIFSMVGLASGLVHVAKAVNDDTSLSETISAGLLSIVAPESATFGGLTASASDQQDTAVIGDDANNNTVGVEVKDERGTGVGWSNTMTVTNLTIRKDDVLLAGSNDDVTASGTYDGVLGIETDYPSFVVEITTGGVADGATAQYSYWAAGTDPSDVADGTEIFASDTATELSNGVKIAFVAETLYVENDKWSILVDVLPYNDASVDTGLKITPSDIHNASGSLIGVTKGSANQFFTGDTATSGALDVMIASKDHGQGDYFIDIDLVQDVHKNCLVGEFTSTATLTVE